MPVKKQPRAIPVRIHLLPERARILKARSAALGLTLGEYIDASLDGDQIVITEACKNALREEAALRGLPAGAIVEDALRNRTNTKFTQH